MSVIKSLGMVAGGVGLALVTTVCPAAGFAAVAAITAAAAAADAKEGGR